MNNKLDLDKHKQDYTDLATNSPSFQPKVVKREQIYCLKQREIQIGHTLTGWLQHQQRGLQRHTYGPNSLYISHFPHFSDLLLLDLLVDLLLLCPPNQP